MDVKFKTSFVPEKISMNWFVLLFIVFLLTGCGSGWDIDNPYEQVDWDAHRQYKANLHTHTTRSDGRMNPHTVVDKYHQLGYDILAITDHNEVTWPWTRFAEMEPSEGSKKRLEEGALQEEDIKYENRDPSELEIFDIQGNELSEHHHTGSFFNDHNGTSEEEKSLAATAKKEGLTMFYHPGRYQHDVDWYINFFRRYDHLLGIEVYNQGDRYSGDRRFWDSLLTRVMPERKVWGFSNDDMHSENHLGRNWNLLLLPELSEEWVRKGLKQGRLFYVYAPEGHDGPQPPEIETIDVSPGKGTINLETNGADSVRWISEGQVVERGNILRLNDHLTDESYVRAELYGPGETVIGTQPFGIKKQD